MELYLGRRAKRGVPLGAQLRWAVVLYLRSERSERSHRRPPAGSSLSDRAVRGSFTFIGLARGAYSRSAWICRVNLDVLLRWMIGFEEVFLISTLSLNLALIVWGRNGL